MLCHAFPVTQEGGSCYGLVNRFEKSCRQDQTSPISPWGLYHANHALR